MVHSFLLAQLLPSPIFQSPPQHPTLLSQNFYVLARDPDRSTMADSFLVQLHSLVFDSTIHTSRMQAVVPSRIAARHSATDSDRGRSFIVLTSSQAVAHRGLDCLEGCR